MNWISTNIYMAARDCIVKYRRIVVAVIFLIQAALANYLSFIIRFDSILSRSSLKQFLTYLPFLLFIRLVFFIQGGLYKGLWRYASVSDLLKIIKSTTLGSIVFLATIHYLIDDSNYPHSIVILDWLLFIIISGGNRLFIRVFKEYMFSESLRKRILIIGAGDASEMIVREMKNNADCAYEPIGLIDDDTHKKGLTIHDVPILGSSSLLPEFIKKHKPDEILISVPTDLQKTIREIYEICKPFNIPIKKMPGISELLDGNISVASKLGQRLVDANLATETQIEEALALQKKEGGRLGAKLVKLGHVTEERLIAFLSKQSGISQMIPISLEDFLQREPVERDISSIRDFINGKSVMVTGAGGSIGSELCRQIIKYDPSDLLLLDRYENSTYEIDLELRAARHRSTITTLIGDVQDSLYLEYIFSKKRPQIIFHAAAYKHVPLMEHNPIEAVKNNIFGTKNLIDAASKYCAESFVLISTDKAVNPTSIMGATKRIAEFLTINMNSSCRTKFNTVRFGNVLGTNGSVIPIFKEQLKKGGPLTVTHPEIKRFFMLIPEAVHLVLIAAATGKGGELFVLEMGEPIKIVDLAENFIRLSGFIPHKEIKITFTGLRPGEKLYEELFDESERMIPTSHKKLVMAVPEVPSITTLDDSISDFARVVQNYSTDEVIEIIQKIIPGFKTSVPEQIIQEGLVDFRVH
jgi:FlaA1/EpsC-like NDP-sugar epimerase